MEGGRFLFSKGSEGPCRGGAEWVAIVLVKGGVVGLCLLSHRRAPLQCPRGLRRAELSETGCAQGPEVSPREKVLREADRAQEQVLSHGKAELWLPWARAFPETR